MLEVKNKMAEKEKMPDPPKWLQNAVKAIYLTGFSVILAILFSIIEFFAFGSNNPERMFGYYMISQMIVSFAFINKNIQIENVQW